MLNGRDTRIFEKPRPPAQPSPARRRRGTTPRTRICTEQSVRGSALARARCWQGAPKDQCIDARQSREGQPRRDARPPGTTAAPSRGPAVAEHHNQHGKTIA